MNAPAPSARLLAALACTVLLGAVAACSGDDSPAAAPAASTPEAALPTAPASPAPATSPAVAPTAARTPSASAGTPSPASTWSEMAPNHGDWRDRPRAGTAPDNESVKQHFEEYIGDMENTYGSGRGAKCWPERPTMWTDKCALGAAKATEAVNATLGLIKHEPANTYPTLRANAALVLKAASAYRANNCASDPKDPKTRATCQQNAHTIALAYGYLRDGVNAGLEGR
ncbi:hypothetical protein [Yinghuangia soli]|uniref:Lipoprotein n=1 Tax=Yinghuangia soli TaxID=2908204 RepID=A0AA41QAB1_9ACTN|nr:hypothetical protein [Yinghuangia soli]MCF2533274.1 hypothetical protein [Yinghuangia soli]